jgi:TolB-like protein
MVKRAITLGGDSPAAASFHRCAAIRESQRRYRANCSVDGVSETLTADLSRISGSFVVGRHTASASKGEAFGPRKIRRERNVLLVLAGAVQRGGKWLRVSTPFVDAESGRHLWAGSFEKPVVDLFDTQGEIAARPANALDTESISADTACGCGGLGSPRSGLHEQLDNSRIHEASGGLFRARASARIPNKLRR